MVKDLDAGLTRPDDDGMYRSLTAYEALDGKSYIAANQGGRIFIGLMVSRSELNQRPKLLNHKRPLNAATAHGRQPWTHLIRASFLKKPCVAKQLHHFYIILRRRI